MTSAPPGSPTPAAPHTTSVNEPTYAASPAGAAEMAPAVVSEPAAPVDRPRTSGILRESAAKYQLMMPPVYENIVGGAAPSPIVSLFLVVGLLALLGAALLTGLNLGGAEWWIFGVIFTVVATTLAGFISRTAG